MFFFIVFAGCAIYGFWSVLRRTRQIRMPRPYKDALVSWAEAPGSSFRVDLPTWAALTIHRGTAIFLGLVALLILILRPPETFTLPGMSPSVGFLLGPLLVGIVAVMGFLWGFMVGGPLAEAVSGDRHYAVSEAGVLSSGRLLPWHALAQFSVDHDRGALRLWSAKLPGTMAYSFHPPAKSWSALVAVLQAHLPVGEKPSDGMARFGFPLRMAALCAPFLVAALILYWVPAMGALMALCVLMWLLVAFGGSFIMRSVYGGQSRPAELGAGTNSN